MAKVEVRPLEIKKWHGKKGKESFTRPKTIEVLYDIDKGGYNTGLTKEETNEYSEKMGVSLSNVFIEGIAHEYWSTKAASIPLKNHTMIFDIEKPVDFVKVKNMKASKFVANSLQEYEKGAWPFATHYIHDENEEIMAKAGKIQLKNKAIKVALEMSLSGKSMMVMIIKNKNVKGRSQDFVDVEIDEIIETQPGDFLKYYNMGKEEVMLRAQTNEMLMKNILQRDGTSINYMGEQIGWDYEAAIEWLKKPENNMMKIRMIDQLNK